MIEKPQILANSLLILSPDELAQIRGFLNSPIWLKFLSKIACKKPSAFCAGAMAGTRDAFSDGRATARLNQICGWELYENAIFFALNPPEVLKQATEETYPDEGILPTAPQLVQKKTRKPKSP